mgnify:CR=1 FL=1
MPDPTLRQLLELARPVRDLSQAIQTAFRLIEVAQAAEAGLETAKARMEAATKEAQALEARKAKLADEIAAERESLLKPVRETVVRLEAEGATLRAAMQADKTAFDEERGRRTTILRTLDEQGKDARKRNAEETQALRATTEEERGRLQAEISELRAKTALASEDLAKIRAEYQQLQDAGARLFGRR